MWDCQDPTFSYDGSYENFKLFSTGSISQISQNLVIIIVMEHNIKSL